MATIVTQQMFGSMPSGWGITLYALRSAELEITLLSYGARIHKLRAPDRNGVKADLITGFKTLEEYLADKTYAGAAIGRYGNRIAQGRFALDGVEYQLPRNNGENSLHGGPEGFHAQVWGSRGIPNGVEFILTSPAGHMGFPGKLITKIAYTLEGNALRIDYEAETDAPTIVNFTNHSFFNLRGEGEGEILDHSVQINADRFTPVDASLIPTGELADVAGTPFDFHEPHIVGERIGEDHPQLKLGRGYDHNFVINGSGLREAATVTEASSGRVLTVQTDSPGMQFYTGNFLDGSHVGKSGRAYKFRNGLCLETQEFPDAPNQPNFPSVRLDPGQKYKRTTVFTFSTQK